MFAEHPGQIAAIILEPAKYEDPRDGFLHKARDLCHANGALFILDEMINGFRWHNGGGQAYYGIVPDLSTFGKAIANGFSVSALAGKRQYMELGGLRHNRERVFLLSTTHGAETPALAAAIRTMEIYASEPVVERLHAAGEKLRAGIDAAAHARGVESHVVVMGRACNLFYATYDAERQPSQAYRALFLQETIKRGVLMPSLVVSYSHSDDDIARTVEAVDGALAVYARALEDGVDRHLVGPPTCHVFDRRW